MESFYANHLNGITNKDNAAFINLFRTEINSSPDTLLQQTANYFIGKNSVQGNLTILNRIKDALQKSGKFETFKQLCDNNLSTYFYMIPSENSPMPNFSSGYNYSVIFSKELLFAQHETDFIRIISILTEPTKFKDSESISISAKLLEKFFEYQKSPIEIEFNSFTTLSTTFSIKQTTFSALGTICIECIKVHSNFDVVCCLIRCLSHSLIQLFEDSDLLALFNKDDQSKLHQFLNQNIPYHCFLLFLSSLLKKFPEKSDTLIDLLDEILGPNSTTVEKCFGYSALSRIVPFADKPIEFSLSTFKYLLRDYDSQNPILPSLLENLYKSSLKRCKALNLSDQLFPKLYESVKKLSWHSMVKLMVIPDIIHSFSDLFCDLIDFAQDPSDYGFVTRCIKTIAKSSPKQTSEDLLNVIIKTALKSSVSDNLRTYRPLLEPLYSIIPEIVEIAFNKFGEIGNNTNNDSNEVIAAIWLKFESLLILPRSKWQMKLFDLKSDLSYAVNSGNWDLRCSSLAIFVKCFNYDRLPLDFILNLDTLMYTDSSKHTFIIEDAFSTFIDMLKLKKNPKNDDNENQENDAEKILLKLLDVFSHHMSSTFMSFHRQFALSLTEKLWKKYPHVYTPYHLEAVASILNDNLLSLRFLCRDKIKTWVKEDPNKKFNISSASRQLLFNEAIDQRHKTVEENDVLLKNYVNEIANNNFESLKELEALINDNKCIMPIIFSKDVLEEQAEKYFDFFISTKNVGISYRSQTVFVMLCGLLDSSTLARKLQVWESRLLSILRDFDMESMRRSASLPDVALSLIRLQPPELTMSKIETTSSHMKITTALIDLLKRTDVETEAVNSLNVLRGILKDKIMSKVEDYLYPLFFEAILVTSLKFEGWDFVAASNLCFAALFHKLCKRSDSTLNIVQFFQKIPKARELVIDGLKSKITHANYLALTAITVFRKTNGDDRSLLNFVAPFLKSKSSRIRREAAVALLVVSPDNEVQLLCNQCIHFISASRFVKAEKPAESNHYFELLDSSVDANAFHGLVLVIREILTKFDNYKIENFPSIDLEKVPPMTLDDICFIYSKLNLTGSLNFPFNFSPFYFDQVSVILYSGRISDKMGDLNDSQLVALLTKVNSKAKLKNTFEFIEGLDKLLIERLKKKPLQPLIFKMCVDYLDALLRSSADKECLLKLGFNAADYLNDQIDTEIQAPLISLLICPKDIKQFAPLFVRHAFNKDDNCTPIKISIVYKLSQILKESPSEGRVIALLLLIDDVPLIRTQASLAVFHFLNTQFLSEVKLFDLIASQMDEKQLKFVAAKWIELIELKLKCDPNGESISSLVDEFFLIRKVSQKLKLNVDFSKFQFLPISEARIELVNLVKPLLK